MTAGRPMTPFELALRNELDIEAQRFINKWLFPWHNINIENRVVEVEDFRGGKFHVGGIVFQGQIQELYWQAIGRYLSGKIIEIFRKWDEETRSYPVELRISSLERTGIYTGQFVAKIIKKSTDTDRRLRRRGHPDRVESYNSTGYHSHANAEIHRLVTAHTALLESTDAKPAPAPTSPLTLRRRFEKIYAENRGLIWLAGLGITGLYALFRFFVG
jgi:hypothetical protein